MIDPQVLERHGLKPDEYERIKQFLGREPNLTELGIFSVMWSEHCSYKSSRVHLKTLPTTGKQVLQGPGENAGAVDIGDGLAAVFKIESHNPPSFIEPYQGAATGVGGIIRDIFTMGARPIALLNSLRFGSIDVPGTRRLLEGVVAGIAGYGNSIGIPTVGGEIAFEPSYAGNPLVNVFCLGIAKASDIIKGVASGVGNSVYYVGAKTGRDGIHGATMASAEFDEKSAEKRPAVQVGDPFMEKLLLEACLEVMQTDALVGIQDMGAAGLTCSTTEMGSRGGAGVEIDIAHVPQRESRMTPYEIMLSESQERMLLVVKRGREAEVERIFDKWDLHAVHIGEVTSDGMLRVKDKGTVVAEIPNRALTDEAPVYRRPMTEPEYLAEVRKLDLDVLTRDGLKAIPYSGVGDGLPPSRNASADHRSLGEGGQTVPGSQNTALLLLLGSATIGSKKWVYRQYDHMVRTNTINYPGFGAGVVRIKGTDRALALSVDGNGRYCYLDPYRGAMLAVAEAARNVACAGARPLGATNCLNFGNPERPAIMWQFAKTVEGIGAACRALDVPITGGNVSLYNETDGKAIYPTPVIGVVGLLEHADRVVSRRFHRSGDAIILLGEGHGELGGSEYLKVVHDLVRGGPPSIDLDAERALQDLLVTLATERLIHSAHDCSDGGLAVTLAECCFDTEGMGADVSIPGVEITRDPALNTAAALFGESASRVLVSVVPESATAVLERAAAANVPARMIGQTGGNLLRIAVAGQMAVDLSIHEAERVWNAAIERYFAKRVA
ncbi:MAG: phosphoribosylformylglycinamidine synthase II [Acidobacteria bacterium 13_1_40CM_65_14]|nr:MAG: phosphoribosylformylglycinamidine synthase II [Acidobacteria bacterium 13_1_40CM_65_14]